ncbi:putative nuclease HARBI1 [Merluccius polli]|uniref:Nuclease HARBI1 n=1 Tax=Merluccius polli TaxID=89951 RepID=A0AA47MFM6_MERPO|nr:putative nuclease HARBI1 [Merluccius polli]
MTVHQCHRTTGLPNVIGCIDGTQIPITAPAQNEGDYVNRKSFHSINVQMHSNVSSIITGEFDGYLLGDRGYPCLLTPYPDRELGPQQHFNVAHCRTRARVEMTIGILKSRFQCLHKHVTSLWHVLFSIILQLLEESTFD